MVPLVPGGQNLSLKGPAAIHQVGLGPTCAQVRGRAEGEVTPGGYGAGAKDSAQHSTVIEKWSAIPAELKKLESTARFRVRYKQLRVQTYST